MSSLAYSQYNNAIIVSAGSPMSLKNKKRAWLAATIAACSFTLPLAPAAQDQGFLEEVIVTSTKRGATALSDTAITVNVVTGDELRLREVRGPDDLRTAVSGVYVDEGSSTPRVAIRGVGFDNFNVQAENGVTTYVDGVVIQRTHAILTGFLDLAQVEVLKGPQGSAFGRNATGGAINLITAKPEEGFSGEVSGGYGSFDRREAEAVFNYGGDKFGVRLAGSYEEDEGFITNLVTGNDELGAKEQYLGRIVLSLNPADNFSLDYSLGIYSYETDAPGQDHTTARSAGTGASLGGLVGLTPLVNPVTGVLDDGYTVVNSIDPFTDREMYLHALTAELDLGWATLKSITGYIDFDSLWTSDVALPGGFAEGLVRVRFTDTTSEQFSQEVLLSGTTDRLNWVAGFYYLDEEAFGHGEFDFNIAAPPLGGLPIGTILENMSGQDLTSYAFFGDGQFELTDRLRLNGGIRWTDDEKKATGNQRNIVTPIFTIPGASLAELEVSDESVTWQAGLEFDVTDEIMTYFRAAEGYKAGGINNSAATRYLPEELISYEIGAKGILSDNFSFAVAGFYSTYENIQLFINPPDNPGQANIVNAASATIAGIDLEVDWSLTDILSIDAMTTYLADAAYDEFMAVDFGVLTDFSGDQLTRSPEFTGIFGVNLFHSLNDRVDLSARAELYVTSEIAFSLLHDVRAPGALTQDGYELVNFFVTATLDDQWDLRVYGKNIGNRFYRTTMVEGVPGTQYGIHGRPDEYGFELRYRF